MNRQEFLEGTLQEIKEHVAQGRATRLLVLLPESLLLTSALSYNRNADNENTMNSIHFTATTFIATI